MNKKQKKSLAIMIVLIGILAFVFSQSNLLPFATTGFSTLSLSKAQLTSQNDCLNGDVWILSFLGGNWGQYATFTPNDVQESTLDSNTTTESFTIKSSTNPTKCIYNIQSANKIRPIYTDLQIKEFWTLSFSCSLSEAQQDTSLSVLYYGKTPTPFKCFAVGYNQKYEVSNIPSVPTTNTKANITISTPTKSDSITVDNLNQGEGKIGDFACAKWNGVIPSGISCQQYSNFIPSDYYASYTTDGRWILIDRQKYDSYNSKFVDLSVMVGRVSSINYGQMLTLVTDIKKLIPSAMQSVYPPQTALSKISDSNAQIIADSKVPLEFPLITTYIKASEIGIYTPTPNIRLSKSSSDCFKTGTQGVISAYAKNTGDEEGTWSFYAVCNNPFVSTAKFPISLEVTQEHLISIPISASSDRKVTGSCVIYAESPAGTKSINVNTCVDPQITCTVPYPKKFCEGNIVKQCSPEGGFSTPIKTCNVGEFCEDGECKIKGVPPSQKNI